MLLKSSQAATISDRLSFGTPEMENLKHEILGKGKHILDVDQEDFHLIPQNEQTRTLKATDRFEKSNGTFCYLHWVNFCQILSIERRLTCY